MFKEYNEEEKAQQKALFIADVSQQRELLNAFLEHYEVVFGKLPYDKRDIIDSWLEGI